MMWPEIDHMAGKKATCRSGAACASRQLNALALAALLISNPFVLYLVFIGKTRQRTKWGG